MTIYDMTEQAYKNGYKAGIKEFAERVKGLIEKHSVGNGLTQLRNCDIDNLLKEKVGED